MALTKCGYFCPNRNALYQVVREAGPETINKETTCRSCGAPMSGREGKFVIKYFLLRSYYFENGGRVSDLSRGSPYPWRPSRTKVAPINPAANLRDGMAFPPD
jgi:hypothetical protein